MSKIRWMIGGVLLIGVLGGGVLGLANASDRWGEDESEHERSSVRSSAKPLGPVAEAYIEECSACHMAYPAGFLPERSWNRLLSNLGDHFGENAEVEPDTLAQIKGYLSANAGEYTSNRRAQKFLRSIAAADAPLRITELKYFKRKHHEIPDRLVSGNPEVGSFSQCDVCHGEGAQQGYFDDDRVNIPGYGRWDD